MMESTKKKCKKYCLKKWNLYTQRRNQCKNFVHRQSVISIGLLKMFDFNHN